MVTFGKLIRISIESLKLLIRWECQLVWKSYFENPPNVVILSKYRFYNRWMIEVSMSVFSNHIRAIDASSWQNKCPELFSSLAAILNFDWAHLKWAHLNESFLRGKNKPTATEISPTGGRCMRPKKFQWFFWFLSHRPLRAFFLFRS